MKLFGWGKAKESPPPDSAYARGMESVEQGRWGERAAEKFLRRKGWRVLGRNVRPCPRDLRCEIDLIFRTREGGVVFVEVKTHKAHTDWAPRLAGVDKRKKDVLLRACANWLMRNRWHGDFRFDVVEVWGDRSAAAAPEIDHVEDVRLFNANWRFW